MSNERERLAREWAESKLAMPTGHLDADVIAAAEHILATTTEPTMADVEWDDKKHYLAGATTTTGEVVVMMRHDTDDTDLIVCDQNAWQPYQLTPNGKRYELVEVTDKPAQADEPEYPETLTTLEDYEGAPDGTIVAVPGWGSVPLLKRGGEWHRDRLTFESRELTDGWSMAVLRWGWRE